MKISLNWLKDFVEFDDKLSIEDITWRLTEATAEIELVHRLDKDLEKVVIGKVKELKKHPDADKLQVCEVDVGFDSVQIVCGGTNLSKGMLVVVSLPGAKVRWHGEGDLIELKIAKVRGMESHGMICAAEEIGLDRMLPSEEEGHILDLSGHDLLIGQNLADALHLNDVVFDIDNHSITHRADLFSHIGFARECVALGLGKWKKQVKKQDPEKLGGKKVMPVHPKFESERCSKNYYSTVIENVSTKPSPLWVRARLHAVGIRSINAIVDITNLVMLEIGQPLHAFDLRLIEGKPFVHRLSKQGEEVTTLDGIKRMLDKDVIVIESGGEIVDLCGIMGAENSAIKNDSTSLYLHCCHYDNVLIRKAMLSLGHRTDAGTIFEKNIEPERAKIGFSRALELFKELFPESKIDHEVFHHQNVYSPEVSITLPLAKLSSHLGIEIEPKKACQYLEDLGFEVKLGKAKFDVKVPSWRAGNITIPEDLIEEIVRIHGYSNVPALPPIVELVTPEKNHKRHTNRTIQSFLTGQGFQEEANFSFLSEDLLRKLGVSNEENLIEIINPVNEDFRFMRPNFLSYLLSNLSRNQILEPRVWKSFEMGAVYRRLEKEVVEEHLLTLLVSSLSDDTSFYTVKGMTGSLLKELSIEVGLERSDSVHAHPNRCLNLMAEEKMIGQLYELHPLLKDGFKLRGSVSVLEINLDELYHVRPKEIYYAEINRNPQAHLDISVVVESATMVNEIDQIIQSIESQYLVNAELMDIYEGKNLGEGKKSFTFALSYQHPERTLEEKEIQDILEKLITALEKSGGVVRR
ncbi:MAG: phenylalanine--tRNA ligase subunit beta [bacterium]|nr:phenylalanine--tRNA ligase subunit beta [bacterium]